MQESLPIAFMKGSKFSWDSSWYFPEKDMVTDSEGKGRSDNLPVLYFPTPAQQSLTTGVYN